MRRVRLLNIDIDKWRIEPKRGGGMRHLLLNGGIDSGRFVGGIKHILQHLFQKRGIVAGHPEPIFVERSQKPPVGIRIIFDCSVPLRLRLRSKSTQLAADMPADGTIPLGRDLPVGHSPLWMKCKEQVGERQIAAQQAIDGRQFSVGSQWLHMLHQSRIEAAVLDIQHSIRSLREQGKGTDSFPCLLRMHQTEEERDEATHQHEADKEQPYFPPSPFHRRCVWK